MIYKILRMQLMLFKAAHYRDPSYVYLGHQEYGELLAVHQGTYKRDSESDSEWFMGIQVIRVNQESHLNVA